MKKCILLFLSFCFVFIVSLNANASVLPNRPDGDKFLSLDEADTINIFKPLPDDMILSTDFYSNISWFINDTKMSKGGFNYGYKVWNISNGKYNFYIDVLISVENSVLSNVNAAIGDNVIYNCNFTNGINPKSTISKEIDLYEYFNIDNELFCCASTTHLYINEGSKCEGDVFADGDEVGIGFLMGGIYNKNTNYKNKDLYFVTNMDNPLTENQILSKVSANDPTEGDVSSRCRVSTEEYKLDENGKIKSGNYKIRLVASDSKGNTTVQNAYVAVRDLVAPQIIGEDKEIEYTKKIDDVSSLYSISDNSGKYEITDFKDNYSSSYDTLGNHTITITAKDNDDNYATKVINIKVVDRVAPVLSIEAVKTSTTAPFSSVNDLYQYVSCVDEKDPNPTVRIDENSSDYFSKTSTTGTYTFKVYGYDNENNMSEGTLTITVNDSDYPTITVSDNVIVVPEGQTLTKEQISNILLQTGQISSLDNLVLTSAYFDTPNVAGDYELIISTPDGVYKSVISVPSKTANQDKKEDTRIDYSIPVKEEAKDNTYLYIACASAGLLIILSLGFVLYKRKH